MRGKNTLVVKPLPGGAIPTLQHLARVFHAKVMHAIVDTTASPEEPVPQIAQRTRAATDPVF
jgi:hypothetical protein